MDWIGTARESRRRRGTTQKKKILKHAHCPAKWYEHACTILTIELCSWTRFSLEKILLVLRIQLAGMAVYCVQALNGGWLCQDVQEHSSPVNSWPTTTAPCPRRAHSGLCARAVCDTIADHILALVAEIETKYKAGSPQAPAGTPTRRPPACPRGKRLRQCS